MKIDNRKKGFYFVVTFLLLCLTACIQENPNLVNPPLVTETVNIRMLNLSGDQLPKTLDMDGLVRIENVSYMMLSRQYSPPYDSVTIKLYGGDSIFFQANQKQKFARNTNYMFIPLPPSNDSKAVDTIISIQTSNVKPSDTNTCYIKFFDANPDASVTYSIKYGCPNGQDVFVDNSISSFKYRQSSGVQAVYIGTMVFSILKNTNDGNQIIGTFQVELESQGQYTIMVTDADEIWFFDDLLNVENNMQVLQPIADRYAEIRVANVSAQSISVSSSASGMLSQNLSANFVGKYKTISTCNSSQLDKITLSANSMVYDSLFCTFDVYKKYTFITFNDLHKQGVKIAEVPPINARYIQPANTSTIRVVNGNYPEGITVSLGARSSDNKEYGFTAGDVLAVNLQAGECSAENAIAAGYIPISVFTSTQPAKYLFSAFCQIENNKEYVLAVDFSNGGNIVLLEHSDEERALNYLADACFFQLVNVSNRTADFSLVPAINDGHLASANSMATFISEGQHSLKVGNNTNAINTTKNKRYLAIIKEIEDNLDCFVLSSVSMNSQGDTIKYRIVNASDIQNIRVNTDTANTLLQDISMNSVSAIQTTNREVKRSFIFYDNSTGKSLLTIGDILLTFNKNYTLIFYGNKGKYSISIMQEY